MERRVLLAISLSFAVLFAYQLLFPPPVPPEGGLNPANPATISGPAQGGTPAQATAPAATPAAEAGAVATPAVVGETAEQEIAVETRSVRAVFSNRGARLVHWILKDYQGEGGQPLDLVPANLPPGQPTPFALATEDGQQTSRLNQALYRVTGVEGSTVQATSAPVTLVFEYEAADGLSARKQVTLRPEGYQVSVTASVTAGGKNILPIIQWGPGLGDDLARASGSSGFFSGSYVYPAEGFVSLDGEVERFPGPQATEAGSKEARYEFAGVNDHYFVSSIIRPSTTVHLDFASVVIPEPDGTSRSFVSYTVRPLTTGTELTFFIGPKQFDVLRAVDPAFTRVINFGMFAWLAVPLLSALKWVNGFIGNYGWSIVVLTILINLVMWPLRHKSVVSMRKMQEIQPEMKRIQDRYAKYSMTDPARQKMNEEVMALYKERGVNPASGCLPMLLTLPVLFAFYSLLSQAIEIRGAEFFGWITDLSKHDPYYVTPLLMGATMFWQQRITPSTADPVQQRVMMIMPVMFTAMFMWAPSGLVVYWFVSNLWAIGQQYFTNWLIGPPNTRPGKPVDGSKSAGAGRTPEAAKR
jgi:YidC/Oxa1 family membrane protein insertase